MFKRFYEGTMDRKTYIKYNLAMICAVVLLVLLIILGIILYGVANDIPEDVYMDYCVMLTYPLALIISLVTLSFDIRRIRHIGVDEKWFAVPVIVTALSFLPIENDIVENVISAVGGIIFLSLCTIPGKKLEND